MGEFFCLLAFRRGGVGGMLLCWRFLIGIPRIVLRVALYASVLALSLSPLHFHGASCQFAMR